LKQLPLLALLPALACGGKPAVPGVSHDEVVFGMTTPLSGPAALYGAVSRGATAWAEEVNAQGGVHGRRIRIVVKDDGYIPGRAVANVADMKGRVFAVLGMIGTASLDATKAFLAEEGVPNIAFSGNPRVFERAPPELRRFVFGFYPDYQSDGRLLARVARDRAGARRLAVFYQNDDFGKDGLLGVKQEIAAEPDVLLAAEVPYEVQDRDMRLHALKLKESRADAVVLYGINSAAANVVKEMARAGYRPRLFGAFTLSDRLLMFRLLGELWEGAHFTAGWPLAGESPEVDGTLAAVVARDPELRGREHTAVVGVLQVMAAVEGLRRAGRGLTRESFVAALESGGEMALLGLRVHFGEGRHHGRNSLRLLQAERSGDGSFRVVSDFQDFPPVF
jgi:branched-chain amino acid transport system substrate-binding protein